VQDVVERRIVTSHEFTRRLLWLVNGCVALGGGCMLDGGDGDLRWWRLFAGVVRTGRAYYFGLASGSGGLCGCLSGCLGLALVALRVAAALQDGARGAPMYGCSVQHSSAQVSGSQGARHSACAECAARDNPRSFDVMIRRLLWRVNGLAGESLCGGLGGGSPRRGDDVHDAPLAAACLGRRLPMSRGQDVRVCSRFLWWLCGGLFVAWSLALVAAAGCRRVAVQVSQHLCVFQLCKLSKMDQVVLLATCLVGADSAVVVRRVSEVWLYAFRDARVSSSAQLAGSQLAAPW
jgi:hypothetical protein